MVPSLRHLSDAKNLGFLDLGRHGGRNGQREEAGDPMCTFPFQDSHGLKSVTTVSPAYSVQHIIVFETSASVQDNPAYACCLCCTIIERAISLELKRSLTRRLWLPHDNSNPMS
jgi:hypothetical protein